ncbi:MAG: DUF1343 domain-containing protein [Bacteroidetes bacterium]|nr:DUF1343 domain-containing protein [Bacteroidota bacterium]
MHLSFFLILTLFFQLTSGRDDVSKDYLSVPESKFILGNENLINDNSGILNGKTSALITNKSGIMQDGSLFLDHLVKVSDVKRIFTPEHGLRGDDKDENYTDESTGLQVVSLYGKKKKPDSQDLRDVDILIYDIQDVGARFYTFINTMYLCMQSALENDREFVVCDRPLIPDGNYTDGFMLDADQESFVGMIDIPVAYGMTCGELAGYINSNYFSNECRLKVIKMSGYSHDTDYESLNLPWVKPSPNIYFPSSAVSYLGTCFFEGTNFSEGRGTDRPFEYAGAPYCDGKVLAEEMNSIGLNGVVFESIEFIPTTVTSPSNPPKYVGEKCSGVYIKVTDKIQFEPVKTGIALLVSLNKLFPAFEIKKNKFIDKLAGTSRLRNSILNGDSLEKIISSYSNELNSFREKRKEHLLY